MVGLEQYLYGVVPSEMPSTWLARGAEGPGGRRALVRAGDTAGRRAFDLYPDTRSQVYLGIAHEKPATNAAVNATAGQVVLYEGAGREDVLLLDVRRDARRRRRTSGASRVPYLVSVADPYDSISPYHDWGPLVFTGTKLAKVLKMKGQRVVDLQPELNSSGRVKVLNVVRDEDARSPCPVQTSAVRARAPLDLVQRRRPVARRAAQPVVFGGRGKLTGLARGLNQTVLQSLQGDTLDRRWRPLKADKDGVVTALVKPTVTTALPPLDAAR